MQEKGKMKRFLYLLFILLILISCSAEDTAEEFSGSLVSDLYSNLFCVYFFQIHLYFSFLYAYCSKGRRL